MDRQSAEELLFELTEGEALRKHARTVEIVMRRCAEVHGGDPDVWGLAGLLHDADYERFPERHPNLIVERLRSMGEEHLAYAISCHYTKWGVEPRETIDKAIIACDELAGFVTACALVRPTGIVGMKPKSVKKKLKDRAFAAKVDREEIRIGMELLGVDPGEHIQMVIDALHEHREELGLEGAGPDQG